MNWVNPWNVTSKSADGNLWAVVDFPNQVPGNYVGIYDDKDQIAYAFNFTDWPDWGNIGALSSGQIDAVRFQYNSTKSTLTKRRTAVPSSLPCKKQLSNPATKQP